MSNEPIENDDTADGETNVTDGEAPKEDTNDTLDDKNAPDELSKPNVDGEKEDEPVGDSD
ncbi:hypothetical protein [Runella sp.]|uniref:hypothetical protein n=1 Tax=Runella sp. TaxID=1960881 RepID=UPI003D09BC57